MVVVCLLVLEVSLGHSMDFNSWAKAVHLISTFELELVSIKLSVFLLSFAVMAQMISCHNKKEVAVVIFNTAPFCTDENMMEIQLFSFLFSA